jgi:hypothetical protein
MTDTPILNREQPPPAATLRKGRRGWLPLLLVGAAIGGLLDFADSDMLRILPGAQALLIGFIPALYFSILVHELGHVVAGLSAGFELRALMVGAVVLTRQAQGWKCRVIPRRILVGGLTAMVPASADRLVGRYIRLTLGGPGASTALLLITWILMSIFPHSAGVRVLLLINLLIVITACVPYTWRSRASDGKLFLLLTRTGPAAERLAAMLYILALDAQHVEPRDWPQALVEKMNLPTKDDAFLLNAIVFRYARALDTGDPERIAEAIECALSASQGTRPDVRRAFYAAACCFQGFFRHDVRLAEAWLDDARKVKGAVTPTDWDSRAMGAIALAKGQHTEARACLTRYLAMLDRQPAGGMIAAERARTLELLRRSSSVEGT